jgi:hypothetical protein
MDMDDISTSKELYPERNPLGLYHMLPPPVRYFVVDVKFLLGWT